MPRPVHPVCRICQGLEHRALRHFVHHQAYRLGDGRTAISVPVSVDSST
jgi:hypothetical protein